MALTADKGWGRVAKVDKYDHGKSRPRNSTWEKSWTEHEPKLQVMKSENVKKSYGKSLGNIVESWSFFSIFITSLQSRCLNTGASCLQGAVIWSPLPHLEGYSDPQLQQFAAVALYAFRQPMGSALSTSAWLSRWFILHVIVVLCYRVANRTWCLRVLPVCGNVMLAEIKIQSIAWSYRLFECSILNISFALSEHGAKLSFEWHQKADTVRADTRAATTWPLGVAAFKLFVLIQPSVSCDKGWTKDLTVW